MTEQPHMYIHLVAGGLGGATGTILTCPLEIIKTRLQSSTSTYKRMTTKPNFGEASAKFPTTISNSFNNRIQYKINATHSTINPSFLFKNNNLNQQISMMSNSVNFDSSQQNFKSLNTSTKTLNPRAGLGIYLHLKFILENEGYRALFKGLGPTLLGVAPYRGIYFYSYANSKIFLQKHIDSESSLLHICSAFLAGFTSVTLTNPVWFIKTRMQLDESRSGIKVKETVNKIFREKGILGFYKGISASYFGVIETAMYFCIYERLKTISNREIDESHPYVKFFSYFSAAGVSKSLASCLCYPHEVARTRLREEGNKYTGFFQTLKVVSREEGFRGLYKGMGTHLIRQIPNSMIVMTTYELIVNYLKKDGNSDE